ncbi:YhcN/YlaJ family sporulation lipoprotein [Sporosarcina sp. HYO08]|uniref:YhcN/YlaJ family sporulation lipoprotein n=1 Tax=Sporosarcina sp. HYO08 TaxID=1759557 RepID=UPI00079AB92F|nr:YhcN/YlaJ family sporulation lipoprotein [Sporosarcina sp. HYO08]KXH79797.1 hypothetical protein AU377_09935 [Sporosarcina sp. HYO08]
MLIRKVLLLLLMLVLLSGCSNHGIRIHNDSADASKAEEILKKDQRLTSAVILFHEKDLLVGIDVDTFSRFHKKKIEKEIKKKLEKSYPDLTVTVSADRKMTIVLDKLIRKNEKDMGKKIDQLKSLLKEET